MSAQGLLLIKYVRMKRAINCAHCGKHLFDTDKSDGAALIEARDKGFIGKIPFLYGVVGCFFFCGEDCNKEWNTVNISEEARKIGNKAIAELRVQTPQIVEATSKSVSKLAKELNNLRAIYNGKK